jgi:hypothetical protein
MEERNLNQDDVLGLIGNFPLEPLFNNVYITVNKLEQDGSLVLSDNILSDVQYVVAAGEHSVVKAGQKVIIDIEKMMVPVKSESNNAYETSMQVKVDLVEVGRNIFALISDRSIKSRDNR